MEQDLPVSFVAKRGRDDHDKTRVYSRFRATKHKFDMGYIVKFPRKYEFNSIFSFLKTFCLEVFDYSNFLM